MRELRLENSIVDDRYEVIRCLGRGSYAEIFLAHDQTRGDESVIIKALNTSLQGTIDAELERTLVENFQNEAVALDKVRHPNIIRRLGHGTAADLQGETFHYLVLEYMPGGDLLSLCRRRLLDLEEALFYFQQVAEALACAHSQQVIHRDIKPNNILLSADRRTIKIADFGVAKITTEDSDEITRVGTNVYAPPEHHPDSSTDTLNQKLTPSADVYSLAKTIYTALTGRAPRQFSRLPITELPAEIMEKSWGAGLLAMLRKATSNQVVNRYQSIQDFWEEFARLNHFLESAADPEATLVRSRLKTNVTVEQVTSQPTFQAYAAAQPSGSRPHSARIIVELPKRTSPAESPAPPLKEAAVISNGNVASVAVAPEAVAQQNKKTVADAGTKKTYVMGTGGNLLERMGIKAEWLRVVFIILLVAALIGIAASTYFHFAEPVSREGLIDAAPNVNMRSEPGGSVITVLPEGTRLRVYEERNGWARVKVIEWPGAPPTNASLEGWVNSRFIKND